MPSLRRRATMRSRIGPLSRPRPVGTTWRAASCAAWCSSACGRSGLRAVPLAVVGRVPLLHCAGNRLGRAPSPLIDAPSRADQPAIPAWSVRSTCSGVMDTWALATAWKSVPAPASRASPAGPIQ